MVKSETIWINVTTNRLNVSELYEFCVLEKGGGMDIFIGTVRDHFDGRSVRAIDYQGYPDMAEKILKIIVNRACQRWPVLRVAVHHRLGLLQLKEASVIIAVSAAHRAEAFDACRFVIEEIKKDLPVWKKEYFDDGTEAWNHMPVQLG